MKKLIIVALILLSKVWATNAQDANELTTDNPAAKNIISENNSQPAIHFSLFTKNELLKFNNPADPGEKTDYLQKSRNQKTGAWILVGVGAVGIVTGIIVESKKSVENFANIFTEEQKTDNTGSFIAVAGACMALGSIPLFISSSKNKRKASAELGNQKTGFGVPSNVSKNITGITLSFPIGK